MIGAGVSGVNAAEVARGMSARVEILDLNVGKLRQVAQMRPGSVLVDIAIDQGGCFESSRTSTFALTNGTLPYAVALANLGWREVTTRDPALAAGLSTHEGQLLSAVVGDAPGMETPAA